jgi:hypothetical protein
MVPFDLKRTYYIAGNWVAVAATDFLHDCALGVSDLCQGFQRSALRFSSLIFNRNFFLRYYVYTVITPSLRGRLQRFYLWCHETQLSKAK